MELSVDKTQTGVRFIIGGEINEPGAEILKAKFKDLDKSSIKTLILDFNKVTHIGSAGIGKLLLFYKDIALNGGQIEIINVSAAIYDLLMTLKLNSVFKIHKA